MVMGSILGPNRVIAKDVKICTYCCYVRCATLIVWVVGMPWHQTGSTQYHAQLGLPEKGSAINGLVVCYSWDLEPLDLLNRLALGYYQPSPEVWLSCIWYNNSVVLARWKSGRYASLSVRTGPPQESKILVSNEVLESVMCDV